MTTLPIISTLLSPIIQKTEYQGLTNIHFPLKESPRWFKRNGGLVCLSVKINKIPKRYYCTFITIVFNLFLSEVPPYSNS